MWGASGQRSTLTVVTTDCDVSLFWLTENLWGRSGLRPSVTERLWGSSGVRSTFTRDYEVGLVCGQHLLINNKTLSDNLWGISYMRSTLTDKLWGRLWFKVNTSCKHLVLYLDNISVGKKTRS